jgi:hypothetical protein
VCRADRYDLQAGRPAQWVQVFLCRFGVSFGFVLGAETLQALFGYGFWPPSQAGQLIHRRAVFAVLSYWIVAVALFSASIGWPGSQADGRVGIQAT